jgi:hypothetical protein
MAHPAHKRIPIRIGNRRCGGRAALLDDCSFACLHGESAFASIDLMVVSFSLAFKMLSHKV